MNHLCSDVQQPGRNPQTILHALQAAFDNVVHAQIASCQQRIDAGAAIAQHAAGRSHDQALHVAEPRDQRIRESNAEIFIARIINGRT